MKKTELRTLALARIALGVVLLVRTTALVNFLPIPLAHVRGPLLGWPTGGWAFAWGALVLPAWVQMGTAIVRTAAAVFVILGVHARAAGLIAGGLGFVALSQDPFGFIFTLYTLFLGTMVLAISDAPCAFAWVPDRVRDPASSARLVRIFVASVYAWSGVAKAHAEWLSGDTLRALAEDGLVTPLARAVLASAVVRIVVAWGVMIAELVLSVALLAPRTRRLAVGGALVLHVAFELGTHPDVMSAVMASLIVACFA